MKKPELKALVKDGQLATFEYYRDGILYYSVNTGTEPYALDVHHKSVFLFRVPTEDVKGASLKATEKAIHLMRWIRKELDSWEL